MPLTPRDKTMLKVLAGVAVLAAVVLFVKVLGGGGGEEVPPPSGGGAHGSPTVSPTPTSTGTPNISAAGRDVFSVPPALGPTPSGSPSPSGTASPTATPTPSHTTIGGHSVSLLDVFVRNGTDMVQVEVDGVVYTRSEGQSFDGGFRVTSISGTCASFTHNGTSFSLCVNPQK